MSQTAVCHFTSNSFPFSLLAACLTAANASGSISSNDSQLESLFLNSWVFDFISSS